MGFGQVPETISKVACPDTSKEELSLINPAPHFPQHTLNLEAYNTTTMSHQPGALGLSTEQGGRKKSLTSVVWGNFPHSSEQRENRLIKTVTGSELWPGLPVQTPAQNHNRLSLPFFMTLFYHILIKTHQIGANLLNSSDYFLENFRP